MDLASALPSIAHRWPLASFLHLAMMKPPLGGQWKPMSPLPRTGMMVEVTIITKNTATLEPYTLPFLLMNLKFGYKKWRNHTKEKGEGCMIELAVNHLYREGVAFIVTFFSIWLLA